MGYTLQDYELDCDWLRGQGIETEEVEEFVKNLIMTGFSMSRKELIVFLEQVR